MHLSNKREKMLEIIVHPVNANESYLEIQRDVISLQSELLMSKVQNETMLLRMQRTRTLIYFDNKLEKPFWRTVHRFFNKAKTSLLYDQNTQFLGTYPKEIKSAYQIKAEMPIFIMELFKISKI
jgi:hypothetical protein